MNLSPDELYERALDVIRDSELSDYFDQLAARLDFSINIGDEGALEVEIPIGDHKIGGSPDVAPDFEWPTWNNEPLTFIAQFNLDSLWPFDPKRLLPARGMLSFFSMIRPSSWGSEPEDFFMHGSIGEDPETLGAWRVIHTPDSADLQRRVLPSEYLPITYPPTRVVSVSNSISLPDWCEMEAEDGVWNTNDFDFPDEIYDYYDKLQSDLGELSEDGDSFIPRSCRLLGYASYYQNDKRENASGFWNCDTSAMRLLAQFYSDGDEMSFAGDGNGYFFIEKDELAAGNFSCSYFGLQR